MVSQDNDAFLSGTDRPGRPTTFGQHVSDYTSNRNGDSFLMDAAAAASEGQLQ